jgi:hypothetical protein
MSDIVKRTSQYIDNESFDETYKESTVLPVEEDPSGVLVRKKTEDLALQWATDSGDSTIIYVGEATAGSITDSGVWRIQRINTTTGKIEYADGDNSFNNNFLNRETLFYS